MERKEAIEVLRKYRPKDAELREALETAVPELKESEDERIQKAIASALTVDSAEKCLESMNVKLGDALAWLEGQTHPQWSANDIKRINSIKHTIRQFADQNGMNDVNGDPCDDSVIKNIDWLNTIYPKRGWKPSEEQLRDLKLIADQNAANMLGNNLINLYNDLQKLWL